MRAPLGDEGQGWKGERGVWIACQRCHRTTAGIAEKCAACCDGAPAMKLMSSSSFSLLSPLTPPGEKGKSIDETSDRPAVKEMIKSLRDRKLSKMEIAKVLLQDMQKSESLAQREAEAIDYVANVIAEIQSVSHHPASRNLRDMPLAVHRSGRGPGCTMWSPHRLRTGC